MGGRGGGGGTAKGFAVPKMNGTEKQVSWAKSIVEDPYTTAMNLAKTAQRLGGSEKVKAEIYIAAANEYKKQATGVVERVNGSSKAIIDNRASFNDAMNALIDNEARKRNKKPYEMQHVGRR